MNVNADQGGTAIFIAETLARDLVPLSDVSGIPTAKAVKALDGVHAQKMIDGIITDGMIVKAECGAGSWRPHWDGRWISPASSRRHAVQLHLLFDGEAIVGDFRNPDFHQRSTFAEGQG